MAFVCRFRATYCSFSLAKSLFNKKSFIPTSNAFRQFCVSANRYSDRYYSEKHEWVTVVDGIGTIGITQYAADKLGDIVYVQLPDVGAVLENEDECGAIESVKAASEIYAPLSGTISSVNTNLESSSGLVNKSPYEEGWILKIKLSNPEELKELMDEAKYNAFLESDE